MYFFTIISGTTSGTSQDCATQSFGEILPNAVCTDIDECEGVDCGGSSTCANGLNKYTCSCAAGWTGGGDNAVCTDIDECEGVDCGGSSTCANGLDKYTCSCAAGWTGPRECADATVDLGDSYGDGWNGAVAHIDSYGATAWEHRTDVQLSMDYYDGHSALGVPLGCLPDGCYRMHFEDLGGYQGEVSIKGSDGSTILNENDLVADKMYFFTIISGTTSGTSQDCATQSFGVVPSTVCTAEPMMA
jgi:hypothetical protein